MIGLGKASVAAVYVLAALSCPAVPPTQKVELEFNTQPPVLTRNTTAQELGKYTVSTTFSRSRNEVFTMGGLHITEFAPQYMISFNMLQGLQNGQVCLAPAAVKIVVDYAPRILLASEVPAGSCQYKAILDHEMRHVGIDVITLNEYLPRIQLAVAAVVAKIQPIGPMPQSSIERAKNIIVDAVRASLVKEIDEFEIVRLNRQQMLDTRQEYMRISKLCQ